MKRIVVDLLAHAIVRADEMTQKRAGGSSPARRLQQLLDSPASTAEASGASREKAADHAVAPPASSNAGSEPDPETGMPEVRPLAALTAEADFPRASSIDGKWARRLLASEVFKSMEAEFQTYPRLSFVGSTERAFLYCLVRSMKPLAVAEIGTAFCGTSEIITRALWENGQGMLHTTDPFGAVRCPPIIRRWPRPLQKITRFYTKSSMDFFLALGEEKVALDIAFVDGNHDFEFAYFDILMAARLLRPGGIMIVDNAEQSGPFYAAAQFVQHNPDWIELGDAIATFRASNPFAPDRSSVPNGSFLALRAPDTYSVGGVPRSTGQVASADRVTGFSSKIVSGDYRGTLHYQLILRAFRDENREIAEYKCVGKLPLDSGLPDRAVNHRLDQPLVSVLQERHGDCTHTLEMDFAWEGSEASSEISLAACPVPLNR